jgi:GrpB-like predicted nucleotidyltransferase (UPF0157 family)
MPHLPEPNVERIIIVEYDPSSPQRFATEREFVLGAIGSEVLAIEHIGSSSVPGLGGKPIIDIIAGLSGMETVNCCIGPLKCIGYKERQIPDSERRFFQKHSGSVRTHHLHLVVHNSEAWWRPIRFRDFLRDNSEEAERYHAIKCKIAEKYALDREGYTSAKSSYIHAILERCRASGMNV